MAKQTDRGMVALGPVVKEQLGRSVRALKDEYGTVATRPQLVAALLDGVPLWQVDYLVRAYIMHTEEPDDEQAEG